MNEGAIELSKNKYEIDMCNGTIMDKLVFFCHSADGFRNSAVDPGVQMLWILLWWDGFPAARPWQQLDLLPL